MRLVDADAIPYKRDIAVTERFPKFGGFNGKIVYSVTKEEIDALPTVDAVPIQHGHWVTWYEEIYDSFGIGYAPHYKCSECDTEYDQYNAMRMNYCPNCGVKLDGKDGDG